MDLANGIYGHHECWDGSGYPKGLKGEEIPIISRMIAVVEAYERKRCRDHYNKKSKMEALQTIRDGNGTRFDPQIAETFIQLIASSCKPEINDKIQ